MSIRQQWLSCKTNLRSLSIAVLLSFLQLACQGPLPPARSHSSPIETAYNRLIFGGDVMLARQVARDIEAAHNLSLPFYKIAPLFRVADIAFVNLESPFSDQGRYRQEGMVFHARPDTIRGLELAGIDVVSTANNHARDCGPHGVMFTVDWLHRHGMATIGSAQTAVQAHDGVVLTRHGIRFGFLGYTFDQQNGNWRDIDTRIATMDIAQMRQDVQRLRGKADVVVVSMHAGIEYRPLPNRSQVVFAHAAVDAGAKLVIGHHPHVVQLAEEYHGATIVYSLGNFVFDQYQREATQHGEVLQASFLGGNLLALHFIPVRITRSGPELEQ